MYKREIKYFNLAREVSKLSDYTSIKIGAVIVSGKNVVSVGYNHKKSHPRQKRLNILRFIDYRYTCKHYIHAEMAALVNAKYCDLSKAVIYVYRENVEGLQNCRPCEACMSAIKEAGIRCIYYTTHDGYCKEELYVR